MELSRAVFDAVARQDVSRPIELTDPEVEWRSFFALGEEGSVYRGHAGIRRYVSDLNDAWEVVHPDIDGAIGVGAVVLLVGRLHFRGRSSGVETESHSGWVMRFDKGRVVSFRAFAEPEHTLAAAGLED